MALDIRTTVSTWLDTMIMMSGYRGSSCLFTVTYSRQFFVCENISICTACIYIYVPEKESSSPPSQLPFSSSQLEPSGNSGQLLHHSNFLNDPLTILVEPLLFRTPSSCDCLIAYRTPLYDNPTLPASAVAHEEVSFP